MNHDLVGVPGLIKTHEEQINKIKFYTRVDNEMYLREHPELEFILENFLIKLIEDQPDDIFEYVGRNFSKTDYRKLYIQKLKEQMK